MTPVKILLSDRAWENASWYTRSTGHNLDAICAAHLEDYFGGSREDLKALQDPELTLAALAEKEIEPEDRVRLIAGLDVVGGHE